MITERFLPNYFTFYIAERWGNPMILLNGIDLLKNIVRQESYEPEELELFIQKRDNLSHELSVNELEEYLVKDELIQKEIDRMVYKLYELTEDRIAGQSKNAGTS